MYGPIWFWFLVLFHTLVFIAHYWKKITHYWNDAITDGIGEFLVLTALYLSKVVPTW